MGTDLAVKWPPVAILVTGVGYIGATLLRRLATTDDRTDPVSGQRTELGRPGAALRGESNPRVVALENFFCTSRAQVDAALPPGVQFIEGDVANARDVSQAFDAADADRATDEPLLVFHLAAQPSAAIAASDPETTERTNLVGARLVLDAARAHRASVVFGGSFRVYGDVLAGQTVDEEAPYGRVGDLSHLSKIYVEQLARTIAVPFVSVRLGVTYGCSPIMKLDPAFMTVPNLFCKRAVDGEVLQVHEDRPVAFVHVEDAVSALLAAARLDTAGSREQPGQVTVNAAPEVMSIGELARTVQCEAARRGLTARVEGSSHAAELHPNWPSHVAELHQPVRPPARVPAFTVRSRLDTLAPGFARHALAQSLGQVLDYFLTIRSSR
jgi:nucleoside-diphosphate-sugar epimerase